MKFFSKCFFVMLIVLSLSSVAEKVSVSGVVVDRDGRPLAGLEVVGDYMIKISPNGMKSIPVGPEEMGSFVLRVFLSVKV